MNGRPYFFREWLAPMWLRLQQLWQSGKIGCDPSRLIFGEQLRRRSPPRLILEIDIGELLSRAVLHDEGGTDIFDRPWRREATRGFSAAASFSFPTAAPSETTHWPSSRRARVSQAKWPSELIQRLPSNRVMRASVGRAPSWHRGQRAANRPSPACRGARRSCSMFYG